LAGAAKSMKASNLVGLDYTQIVKSLKYLEYSYQRTLPLTVNPVEMTDPEFEVFDLRKKLDHASQS
jgi:hypothetical protein